MFSNLKIRWKFLLSSYAVMLVSVVLITGIIIHGIRSDAENEIAEFRELEIQKEKANLKNYVDIAYETIDSNYKNASDTAYLVKRYGNRLKSIVDVAESIIVAAQKAQGAGGLSIDEAKKQAASEIEKIRYDGGTGYVWINDTGSPYPRMVMHPTVPALNGKILDNPKYNCALGKGENLFKAFVDVTRSGGEGFVDYLWPKPTKDGLTSEQPKLSFVRLVPEWNWIIGTGIYVDDAKPDIIEKTILDIGRMRWDKGTGYFWINDTGTPYPRMVMHPTVPALDGKVLDNPKYNCALGRGENLFKAFVDVTRSAGEGFVDYLWPKPTKDGLTSEQPKLSYVRLYEPLQWIIGTGTYVDSIEKAVMAKSATVNLQIKNLLIKISLVVFGVSLIGFFILWYTAQKITGPLDKCTEFADELGAGNLDATISIQLKDEVGKLAGSLMLMGNNLKNSIADVTSTSQALADGASDQAASLEEISSSLEELSAMTKQNADSARMGDSLISETHMTVQKANQDMNRLTESMKEISEASSETQKIVKTIDEIAFQTNLLALNAAVEAARAGEAGAGFAVVADEVRNLAMRAAEAAKDTAGLIEGTVQKVEDGDALAVSTGEVFSQVADDISKVKNLMGEIAQASNEQASGIEQVNVAVSNINNVTQLNVDHVENLVAATERFRYGVHATEDFDHKLLSDS